VPKEVKDKDKKPAIGAKPAQAPVQKPKQLEAHPKKRPAPASAPLQEAAAKKSKAAGISASSKPVSKRAGASGHDSEDNYYSPSYYYSDSEELVIINRKDKSSSKDKKDKSKKPPTAQESKPGKHSSRRHRSRSRRHTARVSSRHRGTDRYRSPRRGRQTRSRSRHRSPRSPRHPRDDSRDRGKGDSRANSPLPVRLRSHSHVHGEADPVQAYLASVDPALRPKKEDQVFPSKGIQRRILGFIRRMARARGTSHAEEWARLDGAAAAAGTSTRTFFSMELDCFGPAASSSCASAGTSYPGAPQANTKGKTKGKGKGGKQDKQYDQQHGQGKVKVKGKGKQKGNSAGPHSPRTPPPKRELATSPEREPPEPGEKNKEVKDEQPDEADFDPPTSSPLPVGTVREGETQTTPVGPPLPAQYGTGKFQEAGLGFVASKGITVMAAPEEHHHLFRGRAIGNGKTAPCLAGRQVVPIRPKSGDTQVKSTCGLVVAPAIGGPGYRLAQHKGWPIAFGSLERMQQVSRMLAAA
jgi:hypothetical protein